MRQGGKVLAVGQTGNRPYYYRTSFEQSQPMLNLNTTQYKMLAADNPLDPYESQLFCDYQAGSAQVFSTFALRSYTWVARINHNFNRVPAISIYDTGTGFAFSGTSTALVKINNKISNKAVDIKFPGTHSDAAIRFTASTTQSATASETFTTTNSPSDVAKTTPKVQPGCFLWAATTTTSYLCKVTSLSSGFNLSNTGQTLTVSKIFTSADNSTETVSTAMPANVTLIPFDTIPYVFVAVA